MLAGWAGKRNWMDELSAGLGGIEAEEIHGLSHFENCIGERLACLTNTEGIKFFSVLFVKVGSPTEQPRPGFSAERIPIDLCQMASLDHAVHILAARLKHRSNLDPSVMRRSDGPRGANPKRRFCGPFPRRKVLHPVKHGIALQRIGEIEPRTVAAIFAKNVARQNDLGIALAA